jgi:hypothetical protein
MVDASIQPAEEFVIRREPLFFSSATIIAVIVEVRRERRVAVVAVRDLNSENEVRAQCRTVGAESVY